MAAAKKRWVVDYQAEREKKTEYVRQQVIAQGLDVAELTRKLQTVNDAAKNAIIPSLDDVTMTELTNLVDEMQHEQAQKLENAGEGEIDSSAKANGVTGTVELALVAAQAYPHFLDVMALLFLFNVVIMLVVGKIKPRKEAFVQEYTKQVDITPWKYTKQTGIAICAIVIGIYIYFA